MINGIHGFVVPRSSSVVLLLLRRVMYAFRSDHPIGYVKMGPCARHSRSYLISSLITKEMKNNENNETKPNGYRNSSAASQN